MRPIDADALEAEFIDMGRILTSNDAAVSAAYVVNKAPTIDPIRAAGGCWCGECKWYMAGGVCGWTSSDTTKNLRDEDDFCSDGEPKEAKDDG